MPPRPPRSRSAPARAPCCAAPRCPWWSSTVPAEHRLRLRPRLRCAPMIRMSVLYPAGDDVTFDVDYYKTNHRDLCFKILGCEKMEVDTAVVGPYVAAGHLYFES